MSRWEFKLPDIGEGVTEGEVVAWLVQVGDVVREDQPMVEVMTDKATVTITSPKAGSIVELFGTVGQVVKVHSPLVAYELGGAAPAEAAKAEAPAKGGDAKGPAATAVGDIKEDLPGMSIGGTTMGAPSVAAAPVAASSGYFADKPLATPATRKLARDLGVDLKRVPPTGSSGRVTKDDVQRFSQTGASNGAAAAAPAAAAPSREAPRGRDPVKIAPAAPELAALEERIPFVGVRRKIAERMSNSKNTAAHFTFVEEVDCSALKPLRERLKGKAEKSGVKLTYLAFIAKAVVAALAKFPTLNSALDESTNELVVRKYVNLGIAASTDAGLMVPVLKGAERLSIVELAREIERLGLAAKENKIKPQELTGSTFTITSLGAQGGLFATPIINFPEVAILGVHQMKEKPVVRDGQIVIGQVMLLSLSFDHRIIDGHVGAAFAYEIIRLLEDPDLLLLEG
ncbi:MAG: 2-oxo acid dehydrogenase subunit E2 [Myxococcales bacterium]|nr:2-oxo acid dehydrogenase subunit E2 [Myxococcales bacterium]